MKQKTINAIIFGFIIFFLMMTITFGIQMKEVLEFKEDLEKEYEWNSSIDELGELFIDEFSNGSHVVIPTYRFLNGTHFYLPDAVYEFEEEKL